VNTEYTRNEMRSNRSALGDGWICNLGLAPKCIALVPLSVASARDPPRSTPRSPGTSPRNEPARRAIRRAAPQDRRSPFRSLPWKGAPPDRKSDKACGVVLPRNTLAAIP
jgi:hypothetical protein